MIRLAVVDPKNQSPHGSFESFVDWACDELDKVAKKQKGKSITLLDGKCVDAQRHRYRFELDSDDRLLEDTPFKWSYKHEPRDGKIVFASEGFIDIELDEDVGISIDSLGIVTDTTFLIGKLEKGLDSQVSRDHPLADMLLALHNEPIEPTSPLAASSSPCEDALSGQIKFIWGPPGTGKTYQLAQISADLLRRGNRVLMVSGTNVAVDQAVLELAKLNRECGFAASGQITRYGNPKDSQIDGNPNLSSYARALERDPQRKKQREQLLQERKTASPARSDEIKDLLKGLDDAISSDESRIIGSARFVATTLASATISEVINSGRPFDAVLYDEVGMALLPQVIFAAGIACKRFIGFGDFRQLPPIAPDESELKTDIFEWLGITAAVDNGMGHPLLIPLATQHRCPPEIASYVGGRLYGGILKTEWNDSSKAAIKPLPDSSMVLVDTSGLPTRHLRYENTTRYNIFDAFLSARIAVSICSNNSDALGEEGKIAIICPYAKQASLIRAMLKGYGDKAGRISCSTVHAYQGSSADIVIFDVTDAYGTGGLGKPLNDNTRLKADRLLNVALTRAKRKFILVANFEKAVSQRAELGNLMLLDLIESFRFSDARITWKKYEELLATNSQPLFIGTDDSWSGALGSVNSASKSILASIPDFDIYYEDRVDDLVEALAVAASRGVNVTICERNTRLSYKLNSIGGATVEQRNVFDPLIIVDGKEAWFGPSPILPEDHGEVEHRPAMAVSGKAACAILSDLVLTRGPLKYDKNANQPRLSIFID